MQNVRVMLLTAFPLLQSADLADIVDEQGAAAANGCSCQCHLQAALCRPSELFQVHPRAHCREEQDLMLTKYDLFLGVR